MAQPAPDELDRFMTALRQVESSNNYTATNNSETKWGVASGAYQFIDATWNNYKNYPRAMDAPPEIQDEYAEWLLTQYYDKYGDWSLVAVAWHKGPGNADAVLSGEVSVYEIRDKSISTGVYIDRIQSASNGLLSSSSAAYGSLDNPIFNEKVREEDGKMVTCIDKLSGDAWVISSTKARKIQNVAQWMATWEGPVRRANNMQFVIKDLYEIVG